MSYVGHTSKLRNRKGDLFSFDFQLQFFKQYVRAEIAKDRQRCIFLSGHSVGAYVCLQILDSLTALDGCGHSQVKQVFLLCPTVMEIAATPNGFTHTPVLNYLRPVIVGFIAIVSILPRIVREYLLIRHIGLHPFEVDAAHGVIQVDTVRNCLFMAMHEMVRRQ